MSTLTASAASIDGSLRHRVDVNGRHSILTDEPETLGGTDAGPAPHELLPAMVAACVSTMIVLYAKRRDWALGSVRVDVDYEVDTTPRQVKVTLHLPSGLRPDQIERLERVADSCPVKRALEAGFTFERELALDPPLVESPAPAPATSPGIRIEPWPAGGWVVWSEDQPAPLSRHDTEDEARFTAEAYRRARERGQELALSSGDAPAALRAGRRQTA